MKLRKVEASDVEFFIRLYIEAYKGLNKYAYNKRRDIKHYFKWLLSRDPNGFLIAELEEPVGFIACDTNWFSYVELRRVGEIHEIFVHPNYRKRGIGTTLLRKAMEYAKSRKRKIMGLWVGVENYEAKKFYEKFGFTKTVTIGKWTRMIKHI